MGITSSRRMVLAGVRDVGFPGWPASGGIGFTCPEIYFRGSSVSKQAVVASVHRASSDNGTFWLNRYEEHKVGWYWSERDSQVLARYIGDLPLRTRISDYTYPPLETCAALHESLHGTAAVNFRQILRSQGE